MLSAIILAAGESKRFGSLKQIFKFENKTFLEKILENLLETPFIFEIIVALGFEFQKIIENTKVNSEKIKFIVNYNYQDGQISTLKEALKNCSDFSNGYLVTLVDHPFIKKETYRYLIEEFIEYNFQKIIIPIYEGRRGHPVIFPKLLKNELLNAPLNEGARYVIKKFENIVKLVKTLDKFILADIDRIEDLEKIIYNWRFL